MKLTDYLSPIMLLEDLPNEILTHVFLYLPTVSSAVALSETCRQFRSIFTSSKRLLILQEAAEQEFGPLHDIVQLVTYNASQPAHIVRPVPTSEALIRSAIKIGRVAVRWEDLYPFKKWKLDYENRRLLNDRERFVLRRALYRLWLFTHAYHNRHHTRTARAAPQSMLERASLLHNFDNHELAEMLDVHNVLRDTIKNNVCPSNGTIRRKFQKRFPESNHQLLFNIHLNYPAPSAFVPDTYCNTPNIVSKFHNKWAPSRVHEPGAEGWGDDILHYYVIEDMLKLDPAQILHLKDHAPYKGQVELYVRNLGEWFDNNGETFCQTLEFVVSQRGGEMHQVKEDIEHGMLGVALQNT